jgi:transcriptional antiterminator
VNLVIRMWLKIQFSPLLILKLSEYIKVVEIAMVQIFGLVEDERTFNNLAFMKNKLHNRLTTHLNLCVRMFTHNFYNVNNFPYDAAITTWKEVCIRYHVDC